MISKTFLFLFYFNFILLLNFQLSEAIRGNFKTRQLLKHSPFYSNEIEIVGNVEKMLAKNDEMGIFALIKETVEVEKRWRLEMCLEAFGGMCSLKGRPFGVLTNKLTETLTRDPTDEIVRRILTRLGIYRH